MYSTQVSLLNERECIPLYILANRINYSIPPLKRVLYVINMTICIRTKGST